MIKAEEIKHAVDYLLKAPNGCFFKKLLIDNDNNAWGIVIGWSGGFDRRVATSFSDGEYHICSKIAINDSALQCDYECDFTMPYDKETGEVFDTSTELGTDFEAEALRLSKEFKEMECFYGHGI